ncbi:MAG TPA: hypothetical protein VFN25_03695 [Dokdonella sp.]|uniref:TolB family protein n=1 Tax=Dokdonella sp. TaxID=2291710 RepID=UPI002D805B40|nr:hypothetical protein [Dokdonella sp.]HET9031990.1 hypothetical protein [Dokdonella sp.]
MALLLAAAPLAAQEWQQLERIDVRPDGQPSADEGSNTTMSISDDGRWVIFSSDQSDLVPDDSNSTTDVFVRDRKTNATRRLSLRPDGSQATGSSYMPHASRDGRFVSFVSGDRELVADDNNFRADVFLLDRDADANGVFDEAGGTSLTRISVDNAGTELFSGVESVVGGVSDNGNHVAFASTAPIDPVDNNGKSDVYLRDNAQASTPVMSVNSAGVIGDKRSPNFFTPPIRISGDGRFVAFSSEATNLVANDSNFKTDIFVHDRDSNANGVFDEAGATSTVRANVGPMGAQIASPSAFAQFDMDGTGRWVAFNSFEDPIGGDPNPTAADIYLHHLATGAVSRINMNPSEWIKSSDSCCGNELPLIARNANVVLFRSSQLYSFSQGVTTSRSDALAWTREGGLVPLTDYPTPTASSDGFSAMPVGLSDNGAYAVIRIVSFEPAYASQQGTYVYVRNTVFRGDFEEMSVP